MIKLEFDHQDKLPPGHTWSHGMKLGDTRVSTNYRHCSTCGLKLCWAADFNRPKGAKWIWTLPSMKTWESEEPVLNDCSATEMHEALM